MSASREKKQRSESEQLSAKQQKAAKEEARKKRNRILYTIIGIVVVILVAALLVWNSGVFQGRSTAYTVDGVNYSVAEYDYYFYDMYSQYASYGIVDANTPLTEQVADQATGDTWYDTFRSYAEQSLDTLTVLYRQAQDAGLTLTDEEKETIDANKDALRSAAAQNGTSLSVYLKARFGPYMTMGTLTSLLERQLVADAFYTQYQDSLEYSDDEINAYYDENAGDLDTFNYSSCFISGSTDYYDTDDADEAEKLAEEQANKMADELKAGGDYETLAEKYTEGQASAAITADVSLVGSSLSSLYGDWLREPSRRSGDVTVTESSTGNGYFVVQFLDRYRLNDNTANLRLITVAAERDSGADAPTDAQMTAARTQVEQILATWQSGDATEDSFAALADENNSTSTGGLTNIYKGQWGEALDTWSFDPARKAGDVEILENEVSGSQGYYLAYYVGTDEPYWRQQAVSSLKSDATTKFLEDETANLQRDYGSGIDLIG